MPSENQRAQAIFAVADATGGARHTTMNNREGEADDGESETVGGSRSGRCEPDGNQQASGRTVIAQHAHAHAPATQVSRRAADQEDVFVWATIVRLFWRRNRPAIRLRSPPAGFASAEDQHQDVPNDAETAFRAAAGWRSRPASKRSSRARQRKAQLATR